MAGVVERAPQVLGRPSTSTRTTSSRATCRSGIHWPVVHRIRAAPDRGHASWRCSRTTSRSSGRVAVDVPGRRAVRGRRRLERGRHAQARPADLPADVRATRRRADSGGVPRRQPRQRRGRPRLGMEAVQFGEDPSPSIAELDAILDRRGTRGRVAFTRVSIRRSSSSRSRGASGRRRRRGAR